MTCFGLAGLALRQGLAHAQHRHQAGVARGHELARDQLAALVVVLAALGMPDQAVGGADVDQHRGGDLAGVGALLVGADVLRAEGDGPALEVLDQIAQVRQRRQHHHFDTRHGQGFCQFSDQSRGEIAAAVQLPVSGDDPAAHDNSYEHQAGQHTASPVVAR